MALSQKDLHWLSTKPCPHKARVVAAECLQCVALAEKAKRERTEASYRYKVLRADIGDLLRRLKVKLADHSQAQKKAPRDWSYVGDLGHIVERLRELVEDEE